MIEDDIFNIDAGLVKTLGRESNLDETESFQWVFGKWFLFAIQ